METAYLIDTLTFFLIIMAELTVLFIGISFLVRLLQEYVPPERIRTKVYIGVVFIVAVLSGMIWERLGFACEYKGVEIQGGCCGGGGLHRTALKTPPVSVSGELLEEQKPSSGRCSCTFCWVPPSVP
ncbi:MAG: hypothetical protein U1D96_07390 [Eubacteriales bacterium]|nr:hypothetical protein [Desulforudis sp.]MBV1735256.1 hypothetical protein [Desulforudis sp.]MDP3044473.1 hypothetical protein [Bacillota bacterium]MDZ4043300.1 hypothetical protein [Eubacteriales bacterium]